MQGTIKNYDHATRAGSLLTDDRSEILIDELSATQDGLRSLRLGQRVRFEVAENEGRQVARSLALVTF